jgi:phosphomannomutase
MVNPSIFKAYDIRGIYPRDLNEEIAYLVGKALVVFTGAKTAVVGRDARVSSPALFEAVSRGILEQSADVVDVGIVSTPMLNFAVAENPPPSPPLEKGEGRAGIMVTASHNPKEYNGFKLCYGDALPIGGETGMSEIKKLVEAGEFKEAAAGRVIQKNILDAYAEKVLSMVDLNEIKPLKVVVDAGNAVGAVPLPKIFEKTPCRLIPLYFELDGSFPNHEANPLKEETLKDLKKKILEEKADLGVAFDGDADRVGFVDEKGDIVRGDLIIALVARELLKENQRETILYDVRSSRVVQEVVEAAGGQARMCRVGHALIKKQMKDEGAFFAGELSSHFYYRKFYNVESGDLTMLKVLEIISQAGRSFSEIVAPLLRYFHSGEINFKVTDKEGVMKALEEKYASLAKGIFRLDGIRLDFDDWWFNVRPSNTEPLLRLNLEAKTKELMEGKKEELMKLIAQNM